MDKKGVGKGGGKSKRKGKGKGKGEDKGPGAFAQTPNATPPGGGATANKKDIPCKHVLAGKTYPNGKGCAYNHDLPNAQGGQPDPNIKKQILGKFIRTPSLGQCPMGAHKCSYRH